jgi:thiol-disulfide isomerase/thioredoxin
MRLTVPLLLVASLVISGGTADAGEFNAVVDIGAPMPVFENLPATDGSKLSSSDLKEDVVVFVFLANHCPWVRGMDGDLVKLAKTVEGKSVRVVGVSVNHREDDRMPAMIEHARKNGYTFTYVFDESQDLGRKLGATRTPEYFVFDKNRKLAYMGAIHDSPARKTQDGSISYTKGDPSEFYVEKAIEALLAGKTPDPAETRAHGCSVEYAKK